MIHNHTATSIAAAHAAQGNASRQRDAILEALGKAGIHGLTREEMEGATGLPGNSIRPRVSELMAAEAIEPSGEIRRTRSGRQAEVLVVAAVMAGKP
jgi:hypothetical protein